MKNKLGNVRGLAFDAFIARKLGMSYGEYKAKTTETEREGYEKRYCADFKNRRQA